ncbi:hypothetical protein DSO57_1005358 [Entomophthora muscae]|uniref:Uncharacterized protein n=1 Tax=Entomophthora muscae TaxID=34485 RepID=A0ACC2RN03_9FUNG|nr:hypothetical protein DSO57_1005358 [Entomophthora muscae]
MIFTPWTTPIGPPSTPLGTHQHPPLIGPSRCNPHIRTNSGQKGSPDFHQPFIVQLTILIGSLPARKLN